MASTGSTSVSKSPLATAILLLLAIAPQCGRAANPCDLNLDGKVDRADVFIATTMALGASPCTAVIAGSAVCDIAMIQRVINAMLSGTCVSNAAAKAHSVSLSWTASVSNVAGYYVYRGALAGGPYARLTPSAVTGTTYADAAVQAGQTYYYVVTAVDAAGNESPYSNQAIALVPTP